MQLLWVLKAAEKLMLNKNTLSVKKLQDQSEVAIIWLYIATCDKKTWHLTKAKSDTI